MTRNLISTVIRRDLLGHDCLSCESGVYTEVPFNDDVVECRHCGDELARWMTKSEILAHSIVSSLIPKVDNENIVIES